MGDEQAELYIPLLKEIKRLGNGPLGRPVYVTGKTENWLSKAEVHGGTPD